MSDQMWLSSCMDLIQGNDGISNCVIEYFTADEDKYIYGMNRQAAVCLEICRAMKVPVKGVIQTDILCNIGDRAGYWKSLMQNTGKYTLDQVVSENKNAYVLMTVGQENYEKAETVLKKHGLVHLYRCEWTTNQYLRQIAYTVYEKKMEEWLRTSGIISD